MTSQEKQKVFESELNLIQNQSVRNEVARLVGLCPDYFFKIPASSTGKYHPQFCLGDGGLIRHTKATIEICLHLINLEMFSKIRSEQDYIIGALILHDSHKTGGTKYTRADHPILAAQFIEENCIDVSIAFKLCELVKTHMGQWNTEFNSTKEILPKPTSPTQKFVHLCDYLASRKNLEVIL